MFMRKLVSHIATVSSLPLDKPIVSLSNLTDDLDNLKAQMNILTQEIQVKFLKVLDMVSTSSHDRIDYRCLVLTLMSDDLTMFDESDKQLTEAKIHVKFSR